MADDGQRFTLREVLGITGLRYSRVDEWDRLGVVRPSIVRDTGRGNARVYSFGDLVRLAAARELRGHGIPLATLRRVVARIPPTTPAAGRRLVIAGGTATVCEDGTAHPKDKLYTVLDLAAIARDVQALVGKKRRAA
jgi:DNA-binding transcriptional MerR regulator